MGRLLVRSVTFAEDGMAVEYMTLPEDARENGLSQTHSVWIPRGEDYDDEIDAVEEAANEAVKDALEDFGKMPQLDIEGQVEAALAEREDAEDDEEAKD